ncbi:toprim domain-containing protein [Clostridium perfringens]|uniref:toprim domain-containing protein n=1 Tax=Clostridium perfringens TaxID=1502 RepID=UPI003F41BE28
MNKDKIKQLDTRDQCRLKLPIFYGSRDNYYHGFREVCANGIDEIVNNFENGVLEITLHNDLETITVKDSGRGVPINLETDGTPNYKLLFETLFSGTNFDNNDNGKITTGVNGSGTCVLNHTSKLFKVVSSRDGGLYELVYKDGGIFQSFNRVADSEEHYSEFTFKLDEEVYTKTKYDYEEIYNICHHLAVTNSQVKVVLKHSEKEDVEFHYNNLEEYFDENTSALTSPKVICHEQTFNKDNEINTINCLFSTSSEIFQETYLNSNFLPYGGTINEGIVNGFRNYINKYGKENINKFKNVSKEDIEDSLCFVISLESTNVEYENQIKFSTKKKLYRTIMQDYIQEELEIFRLEDSIGFNKLLEHIFQIQKFNEKSEASKKALKKKLNEKIDNINNRVGDLVDSETHGEDCELYITEGKSALGSVVLARYDSKYQAAMPIRGKILNCLKANYETILKNAVIMDLVKVIGCGIQTDKKHKDLNNFDMKNLRYGKIILATDQDTDGENIICLLLTMINRLMPKLIEEGRVFIAQTPLYEVKLKDDSVIYWYSEDEKNKEIDKYNNIALVNRAKGLGELEPEVMSECAMNPETRHLIKVEIGDIEKMQNAFSTWMDEDVAPRKEYLTNNLDKYLVID